MHNVNEQKDVKTENNVLLINMRLMDEKRGAKKGRMRMKSHETT